MRTLVTLHSLVPLYIGRKSIKIRSKNKITMNLVSWQASLARQRFIKKNRVSRLLVFSYLTRNFRPKYKYYLKYVGFNSMYSPSTYLLHCKRKITFVVYQFNVPTVTRTLCWLQVNNVLWFTISRLILCIVENPQRTIKMTFRSERVPMKYTGIFNKRLLFK